jgi:hypothetical protein
MHERFQKDAFEFIIFLKCIQGRGRTTQITWQTGIDLFDCLVELVSFLKCFQGRGRKTQSHG